MALTNVDGLITSVETGTEAPPREVHTEAPVIETPHHEPEAPRDDYAVQSTPDAELPQNDSDVDDYGNPKQPAKMYTEEEVSERINTAMRKRWREEQEKKQYQTPAPQNPAQDFKYDEANTDSWEQQLETFVERTLDKVSQKQATQAHQLREQAAEAEFATRITTGMQKFPDFVEVVGNKPISDAMTIATRGMKDPAAFLYAASKTQGAELERISKIADPYAQVAEMGRLEERMRKVRSATNAPKPVAKAAGDMGDKSTSRNSVDDKIHAHAKTKFR